MAIRPKCLILIPPSCLYVISASKVGLICALSLIEGFCMETVLTKGEKIIAIIVLLVIALFFVTFYGVHFKSKTSSVQFENSTSIDYNMARPESAYSEYSLSGREHDYTFEGAPPVHKAQNQKTEKKIDKANQAQIAKAAEAKKQEEAKKKQAEKQAEVAKTKAQTKSESEKKLMTATNSDNSDESATDKEADKQSDKQSDKQTDKQNKNSQSNSANVPYAAHQQGQPQNNQSDLGNGVVDPNKANDPNVNKKTFAEWRTLLFAKPTPDNLTLFVGALRKNEITATEYQAMAQDLIDQKDGQQKGLGLMALRAAPSLASLSQLVHLEPEKLSNYQLYAEQSLNAYLQPQNLQYLNQALLTKDKKLIIKSLALLSINLTKFSQGDLTDLHESRGIRSGELIKFSMTNYKSLLPTLAQLVASGDPELSGLAQQTASLIQSSNTLAQN